ncbi:MAG TPA: HAMP domain-containing sensor histidine kinase [Turneriella sp.]|nr:HAMP domain-containing sensor histidine kinase [Turneriella sp.]
MKKGFVEKIIERDTYASLAKLIRAHLDKKFAVDELLVQDALGVWHSSNENKLYVQIRNFRIVNKKLRVAFHSGNKIREIKKYLKEIYPPIYLKLESIDLREKMVRFTLLTQSEDKFSRHRFQKAQENARRQFEKKLNLFGKYSHDLKTPFSTLITSVENMVLSDEPVPAKLRMRLDTIRTAIYSTLRTAGQSLDAARLFTRRRKTILVPYNFSQFVKQLTEFYEIIFESYGLTLSTEIHPNIPVEIDPIQMEKVLNNLLNNAVKHNIPGGFAHVALFTQKEKVVLKISDTGLGHVPNVEKIKDRNPWNFSSHGYGLEIVRELVKINRGRLHFENKQGVGTTVTVSLPHVSKLEGVVLALRGHNFQTTMHEVELLANERIRLSRKPTLKKPIPKR